MKKLKYIIFLCGLIGITAFSCKKEIENDPAKLILGKWEIIEMGNWPDMQTTRANGYHEFLQDSIIRSFEYDKNQFTSQKKYWVDSLLHEGIILPGGGVLVEKMSLCFY